MARFPSGEKISLRITRERKQEIVATITRLLQKEKSVQFAYLYGSFLDDELPCHDLDLGVYLGDFPPLAAGLFAVELGGQLGRKVNCPVDVRVLNNAPVPFMFQVLRGRLLLEKNPGLHERIFERTVSRYLDLKPLLLRATKEAFAGA